jgi:hypothetical protein
MKNLDQIRTAAAMAFWQNPPHPEWRGESGNRYIGVAVSRIYRQGLLCAISAAKNQSPPGHPGPEEMVMLEIGRFLASRDRALLAFTVNTNEDFLRGLAGGPSSLLLQATQEALLYLGYLKRLHPH